MHFMMVFFAIKNERNFKEYFAKNKEYKGMLKDGTKMKVCGCVAKQHPVSIYSIQHTELK